MDTDSHIRQQTGFAGLLKEPGQISADDVRYFRSDVFRDGVVSPSEAEAIFALNAGVASKCPEWDAYFVEALTQYVVDEAEPRGYVTNDDAQWLIGCITRDGRVEPANELELLVKILDRAKSSPELLVGFALQVVTRAVLEGEGPLASGRLLQRGVIGEAEVELIRRILYAYGGDAGISISRTEAEILFDLNDRTWEADNHPAWRELFVKAIGNYLMAAATERASPRTEALAREEWLQDTGADVSSTLAGAFTGMGKMFSQSFWEDAFVTAHRQTEKAWAVRNARMQAQIAEAEKIGDAEADWLIDKLNKDGLIEENERALLAFIRNNSGNIAPALDSIMEQAAASH